MSDVRVSADAHALSRDVAAAIAHAIERAVAERGRCAVALSGGETPRPIYRVLAQDYRAAIPWRAVQVFWSDERFVPPVDPRSNYRTATEDLLEVVPIPADNVHPVRTDLATAADAARAYEATVADILGTRPRLDLLLLGLGDDGHTASLFPHSPALKEQDRTVVASRSPAGENRVTLTLPVITRARLVYVVAGGSRKADPLRRALAPDTSVNDCPAAGLRHAEGEVSWWVDRAAMP
jgi:6-phosphogluconolactonase